jgi:NADPH:quinone reductase-like Zn-dependent oxidoreductase
VQGWHLGQRVVSVAFGGAYAELAVVPVTVTAAVPKTIGLRDPSPVRGAASSLTSP